MANMPVKLTLSDIQRLNQAFDWGNPRGLGSRVLT